MPQVQNVNLTTGLLVLQHRSCKLVSRVFWCQNHLVSLLPRLVNTQVCSFTILLDHTAELYTSTDSQIIFSVKPRLTSWRVCLLTGEAARWCSCGIWRTTTLCHWSGQLPNMVSTSKNDNYIYWTHLQALKSLESTWTVEPLVTKTSIIRTTLYYGQLTWRVHLVPKKHYLEFT